MDKINWNDDLCVADQTINEQHKRLIDLMNRTFQLKDEEKEKISEILSDLTDYTFYHFSYEEKVMEENRSPGLESHIREHRYFTSKIANLCLRAMEDGGQISESMKLFLRDWLLNHIKGTDIKEFGNMSE